LQAALNNNLTLSTYSSFLNDYCFTQTESKNFCSRYYDPSVGRFLQQDPDPGKISMPNTFLSKYIYTGNMPTMFTDSTGRSWLGDLARIVVAVVIVVAAVYTGGTVFTALAGEVAALASTIGLSTGVGAGLGTLAGYVGAVAAGATVGTLIGAIGNGTITSLEGGSFSEGALLGAKAGFVLGGVSGGLGAGFDFGLAETPRSIGSFVSNNALSIALPSLLLPMTREFNIEFSCGSYLKKCENKNF
jgi:RHS repeat-associated protein